MFNESVVTVNIQKMRDSAVLPEYKTEGAAGFDLFAAEQVYLDAHQTAKVALGWAFEIPEGYELQIRPRSGVTLNTGIRVALGTIDSDYRGEVSVIVDNIREHARSIDIGERIAQAVLNKVPRARFVKVPELTNTNRGTGGFGSTGV